MRKGNIDASADENNNSAFIDELKQRLIEKRVLAYITKVIRTSSLGYCCVSQAVIRRALHIRKQAVTDACRNITKRGELIRFAAGKKNRKNPKCYYFLPTSTAIAELSGNSIKSSFSNNKDLFKRAGVSPDVTFHTLRAANATERDTAGQDRESIHAGLGWSKDSNVPEKHYLRHQDYHVIEKGKIFNERLQRLRREHAEKNAISGDVLDADNLE